MIGGTHDGAERGGGEASQRPGLRLAVIEEGMSQPPAAVARAQHGFAAVEDPADIETLCAEGAEKAGSTAAMGAAVAQPTISPLSQAATITAPGA